MTQTANLTIKIEWPDGSTQSAESFEALEQALAANPWNSGKLGHRIVLVRRAHKWSGTFVSPFGSSETFIKGLAHAKLFKLI
jgi:hypothetical protein